MNKMEDNQMTTKIKDDQNGKRPKWKTTIMEEYQNGRGLKWKTTKKEEDQNGRRSKWRMTKMEDDLINVGDCGWRVNQPENSAILRFRDFYIRQPHSTTY